MTKMNNCCCTQACKQGRNCPLIYRHPRTLREAFPCEGTGELEIEPKNQFLREPIFWVDVGLGMFALYVFALYVDFFWSRYL